MALRRKRRHPLFRLRLLAVSAATSPGVMMLYNVFVYVMNLALGANGMFLMADRPQLSTVTKMIAVSADPRHRIVGLSLVAAVSVAVPCLPCALREQYRKLGAAHA